MDPTLQIVVIVFMVFLCALCLFAVVVIARDMIYESAKSRRERSAERAEERALVKQQTELEAARLAEKQAEEQTLKNELEKEEKAREELQAQREHEIAMAKASAPRTVKLVVRHVDNNDGVEEDVANVNVNVTDGTAEVATENVEAPVIPQPVQETPRDPNFYEISEVPMDEIK